MARVQIPRREGAHLAQTNHTAALAGSAKKARAKFRVNMAKRARNNSSYGSNRSADFNPKGKIHLQSMTLALFTHCIPPMSSSRRIAAVQKRVVQVTMGIPHYSRKSGIKTYFSAREIQNGDRRGLERL
jgi:hypothetical protein